MLYCLFMAYAMGSSAQQYTPITIDKAIELALQQDPSMLLADLKVSQNDKLSLAGVPNQSTQIFLSGDEFNFEGISGVQSLNIQQTFNMPKVSQSYKNYYKAQMAKSSHLKVLTRKDIVRNVELAYFRLVITKKELALSTETETIYGAFYNRSKEAYESGESNKLSFVSSQTLLKKARLNIDHASHELEIAREIFNMWLGQESNYDVETIGDPILQNMDFDEAKINPHLSMYQYEREIIQKNIEMQKSRLLPKLNTGLKLQSVNGDLLYFGYQIGVNVPLFRGAYNQKLEAARVSLDIVGAERKIKEREINRKTLKLKSHLKHLLEKIDFYDIELLPSINEQVTLQKEAYQLGEGSYVEYMMSIESYNNLKTERLEMIEDFYINSIELKYWTEVK